MDKSNQFSTNYNTSLSYNQNKYHILTQTYGNKWSSLIHNSLDINLPCKISFDIMYIREGNDNVLQFVAGIFNTSSNKGIGDRINPPNQLPETIDSRTAFTNFQPQNLQTHNLGMNIWYNVELELTTSNIKCIVKSNDTILSTVNQAHTVNITSGTLILFLAYANAQVGLKNLIVKPL